MSIRTYVLVFSALLLGMPLKAQVLTEAEVLATMEKALLDCREERLTEALEGFLKVGGSTRGQRTDSEREVYVRSQTMAVRCYEALERFEEGFLLSEELLKGRLTEKEKTVLQQLYVKNGYLLGASYMLKGNRRYKQARQLFGRILPFAEGNMRRRILNRTSHAWFFEGARLQMEQKYDEALHSMEKARDGYHDIGETRDEALAWYQIGIIRSSTHDLTGGMEACQAASALAALLRDDAMLMETLRKWHGLSMELGDSELSLALSQRMDSLATVTDNGSVRFKYYSHLGDEAMGQGNYRLSEQWYRKNDGFVDSLGPDYKGAERYLHYSSLRNLYTKARRLEEALGYALDCRTEFQKGIDPLDGNYYMPYMSIAEIYKLMGDSLRCFGSLDTLFLSLPRLDEPKEAAQLFAIRAVCHAAFRNYRKALEDYRTADSLLAGKYGQDDGDRIRLLPLMGGMEHRLERHAEAERLYREYAERIRGLYGDRHQDYIAALGYLANAEGYAGHLEQAIRDYTSAVDKLRGQIRQSLPYLSTAQREGYWSKTSALIQDMTPFALEAGEYQTAFTTACYDGLVLSKAFLLASERSTYDLVKRHGSKEDIRDFSRIASMQARLRGWENEGIRRSDSILALTSRTRKLEESLARRCRSYGDMATFMGVGYREIKASLRDDEVLIDFTDFVLGKNGREYAAYLVDNRQECPLLTRLFKESTVDSMQVRYPEHYYIRPHAQTMYRLLWEPFRDKVAEGATVYYVPSQLLFQIALESLPMEDGSLLGDHYRFVRLSSARELAGLEAARNGGAAQKDRAVLYGGLLYDLKAADWETEARKYDLSALPAVRGDILRGDSVFRILPGTRKEVDDIERILKAHGMEVEKRTEKSGTEESFLSMNGKAPQILHVATHGFYYTPDEAQEVDYLRGYRDALSLSGLVMSGGNAAWLGRKLPEGVLGGILTASNIARLDLDNIQLAVLSACETGKGQATAEGLYGLQRAFKKAGVKTMVMSLWDVNDRAGRDFMHAFYENLLDKDGRLDKRKAFEKAKEAVRRKYRDPSYWACFVMVD